MLAGLESPTHLILIFLVILLLFGAKRLPELGRSLGRGIHEFKEGLNSKGVPPVENKERFKDVEREQAKRS
jgi:sec-independent protein translocase protein TatA